MKFPRVVVLTLITLCWASYTCGAEGEELLSFSTYAKQLEKKNSIVFMSSCAMQNGDHGILVFDQAEQGGKFFQLHGNKTVRYERLALIDGGFEIKSDSGARYLGKGDETIRTLIRSYPYFMMPAYEIGSVLHAPPKGQCFE